MRRDVIAALRGLSVRVLFLRPYSPEYNPIEKAWGKLKGILRRLPTLSRAAFDDAVAFAMSHLGRTSALGDCALRTCGVPTKSAQGHVLMDVIQSETSFRPCVSNW
jgi:hypothetical protein